MNFTLHQLQVFVRVARNLSVTQTAEELHLTQPAVSIQLRNFQDQFDLPLTEVIGRKLYLTDFGKEIARAAETALEDVIAIQLRTHAFQGKLSGRLKISAVSTGKYVMPYFLSSFLKQNPEVELTLDVTNKSRVIETLQNNETDFALVSILPETLPVNRIELLPNRLYLVGNQEVASERKGDLGKMFGELPLLFREAGSGTRQVMEKFIQRHRVEVRKKVELTSNETVKQAVLAGLGYSIMPLIGITNEVKSGEIRIIPVKGLPIRTNWQLIWLKKKNLSLPAQAFLKHLKSEKEPLLKTWFADAVKEY